MKAIFYTLESQTLNTRLKHLLLTLSLVVVSGFQFLAQGQNCIPYPGYTTWLGYTSAWEDSANWCPPIVPINANPAMNVRIPGGPSGPYTYFQPEIGAGVHALAGKLRIESSDTIFIRGVSQSSLTVNDSVKIQDASSAIVVNGAFMDTVQVTNSTDSMPDNSPLNHYSRSRSFLVFTQSELLANGLQTGDVVTNLWIHIQRKSNGNPYKNCTVKYYYTSNSNGMFAMHYNALIPIPVGAPAAPVTIYSGDLYPPAFIPTVNGYGTIDLALQTPFAWSGSNNPLVIEICYDNTGFPTTGINEEPRFTQTGTANRYLSIRALTSFILPGCNLNPQDTIVVNATWTAGSNTITVSSPTQAAAILPGMLSYDDGRTVISIVGNTITMNSVATTSGTNTNLVLSNVIVVSSLFRPNMTFVIEVDSTVKYPINVRGHWENNGTFVPGFSRVTFDGTIADQQIGGQSKTNFYDLDISNPNHVIRLTDFVVEDSLQLISGNLKLNLGMVTLLNPDITALTRIAGYIQSETDLLSSNIDPFGRVYWKMGSMPGVRLLPFVSSTGVYIPMTYNILSGNHDIVIGTFGTLPDNTNLPLPEVTNVIGFSNGTYNSSGDIAADRFYLLHDSLGINPVAQVIFRYTNQERAVFNASGVAPMAAQRWINATDIWEIPLLPNQVYTMGVPDQVILNIADSVFDSSDWWTISSYSAPLGMTTGLQETGLGKFVAYPNPAHPGDLLNLVVDENLFHPQVIRMYSVDGREVLHEQFENGTTSFRIPFTLSPGVYSVRLEEKGRVGVMRIVVME